LPAGRLKLCAGPRVTIYKDLAGEEALVSSAIRVEPLTDEMVEPLCEYLMRDPCTNLLLIEDVRNIELRRKCEIHVALRGSEIEGYLLVFQGFSVWIFGGEEAASELLKLVKLDKAWVNADCALADLVKKSLPVSSEEESEAMVLERGRENLLIRHAVRKLEEEDAEGLLDMMRESNFPLPIPDSVDEVRGMLRRARYYGTFLDDLLVSAAGSRRSIPGFGRIGFVLTRPRYRGRGFATSVVSYAVRRLFEEHGDVGRIALFTKSRNIPAKRVYEKVGFRSHRKFVMLGVGIDIGLHD